MQLVARMTLALWRAGAGAGGDHESTVTVFSRVLTTFYFTRERDECCVHTVLYTDH